ncbi:hypothetical protein SUDANB95_07911 (plasmid) [Actinosynnema sp. ALI-1.44]
MRGAGPFAPQALDKARREVQRPGRPPGLSVDELAAQVGTTRQRVLAYLHGASVPDPAKLAALAGAVGVPACELTGVPVDEASLADLRRHAGCTRKTAAARVREVLARPAAVRCTAWTLGELEAGQLPTAWDDSDVQARLRAALVEVYAAPADRIDALWPAPKPPNETTGNAETAPCGPATTGSVVAPTATLGPVAPTYRLVGPTFFHWYTRCPSCELVGPPTSGTPALNADGELDWRVPAELRCGQCGTVHKITVYDLVPHDAEVVCVRSTCARPFPAPSTAVEATCDHCHLVNHGPAALADPAVHHHAATVRHSHTLELQGTLAAAKRRAVARALGIPESDLPLPNQMTLGSGLGGVRPLTR